MSLPPSVVEAFLRAASVPRTGPHTAGTLDDAEAIRGVHPTLADASLPAAAALGDLDALAAHLGRGAGDVRRTYPPYGWDALTHLCFSRYLRLDTARHHAFTACAERLLAAGADPDAGWPDDAHSPAPVIERVLYGAAGIAGHVGVTRALLAAGADPNDDETPYHAPEGDDPAIIAALLESGRCTPDWRPQRDHPLAVDATAAGDPPRQRAGDRRGAARRGGRPRARDARHVGAETGRGAWA
ncbi:MAG: hypothetical protein MUE41_17820 [Gemmatimonadaceae bacterium]|nr:hypothetical protein [Gemmatimonadaceae bacterium]